MKLDETELQEVVEKIAYQQFGAEQIDDLYAKMDILNSYVQEQLHLFAVMGELTCDGCGCHPNVIYTNSKGRFCERCKPAS